MSKSGVVGLCMMTSALSGFAYGYFADAYSPSMSENAVAKGEAKPNRVLNGIVGGLCAVVAGTTTAVALNRRYGYHFEEHQNSYR